MLSSKSFFRFCGWNSSFQTWFPKKIGIYILVMKGALPKWEKVQVVLPNFSKILLLEGLSSLSPPLSDNVLPWRRTCPPGPKVRIVVYDHDQSKVECHLCPQKFAQKQGLVRHIKLVLDQIRIQCKLCPLTFTQKDGLNVHIKLVHEQIIFQCGMCSKKFTQKGNLGLHILSVHDQIKIKCNLCTKKFTRKT